MLRSVLSLNAPLAACFATCLAVAPAALAGPAAVNQSHDYPIITDSKDRAEGPVVIAGCELKPKASCSGADLRNADLSGLNSAVPICAAPS